MITLGISTATARGGAALLRGDVLLGEASYEDEMKHAERLFAALDAAMQAACLQRDAIEAVACDIGPGSFTGVRVGLASAKGIALALGVPLVGVCSLEAMAAAAFAADVQAELVCPVLDAKRGETFVAVYDRELSAVKTPAHVDARDTLAWVGDTTRIRFCGRRALELLGDAQCIDAPGCALPDAGWVARLAARRPGGDLGLLEPLYLRAPDAVPQVR
jgi:tRNA threonylcarbamoyladenosine biosynthesis protein TsaB